MRDPYVVIEWSDRKSEAKGWLVIDSIRDEFAAGGLRMNVTVNREEVERLAQVMSYKYVAAEAEIGGAKGGIIYDYHKEDALEVMERYLEAMKPYLENQGRGCKKDKAETGNSGEGTKNYPGESGLGSQIPGSHSTDIE